MNPVNQEDYREALKWIVKILRTNKIKFNVLGGLAAYSYGSKRMLIDIDFSMSYRDMKKLAKLTKEFVIEPPTRETSSTDLWRGGYMELNYNGIAIEIGEANGTEFFNKKLNEWEKFPDGLSSSRNENVFGMLIPIMPKKNLIGYKSKLGRDIDLIDIKNLK